MSRNLPCRVTSSTSVPVERGRRRVEGLQRAERDDVDARDRAAVEPAAAGRGPAPPPRAARARGQVLGGDTGSLVLTTGRGATLEPWPPHAAAGGRGVFLDARGGDRALRVSWHHEADVVVLSLWRGNVCSGSFRLAVDEVPDLIDALRDGLDAAYDGHRPRALSRSTATLDGPRRHVASDSLAKSTDSARRRRYRPSVDPIRNPYAPGAGQRPPELAGRDRELQQFEVTLERVAAGRPERSMVLSGLRGVGKTVLLNALRGLAVQRAWGTGKIEARPDQSLRLPLAQAVHAAVREVGHRHRDPDRVDEVAGVVKAFALRTALKDRKRAAAGSRRIDVPAAKGRADSGDLELDLIELFTDVAALAGDLGVGIALFVDEMQDIAPDELAALCGACHEISQQGAPLHRRRRRAAAPAGRARRRRSRTPSGCSATSCRPARRARWPTAR